MAVIRLESKGRCPATWQGGVYLFQEKLGFDSYTYNTLGMALAPGWPSRVASARASPSQDKLASCTT